MNEKEARNAEREARRDLAAYPERPRPQGDSLPRYVTGLAYAESHPRREAPGAERTGPPNERHRTLVFSGKYLSVTSFRRDGTGVATPVWFVQEDGRLLVHTEADSYKVRRIRRNPSVIVAICTATGRLRGEQVTAHAELLDESEVARVEKMMAHKYRVDMIFIRPIRALQALLHRGAPRAKPVILAIHPG